ncbi:hypothetical protein HZB78_04545 [Candidatus Collierbacteria bacterium]|nr:hypothetical protein [Candidatus Collierbacteria bacterium]
MKKNSKFKTQSSKLNTIILPLFALLFTLYLLLFTPFRFSGWNGRDPMNVVVSSGDQVWFLALRPEEKKLIEISIPENTIVKVGSGKWQAGSLKRLSRLEKSVDPLKPIGWELLEAPVDFVVEIGNYQGENTNYFSQVKLLKTLDPGSFLETIKVIRFIRNLNQNQFMKKNIGDVLAARIVADPSGTELLEIDTEALSTQLLDWFRIESLRREGLTVAVVNVSGKTNAGGKLARQLEHVGIRVVAVSSGEGKPGFKIKSKESLKSETVRKLSSWLKMKPSVSDFDARADILILK